MAPKPIKVIFDKQNQLRIHLWNEWYGSLITKIEFELKMSESENTCSEFVMSPVSEK